MSDERSLHRFAHEAMTTAFEVVIAGQPVPYARQAAQAVFSEIDRLEGWLSRFDPGSDISQINRLQPGGSVRVSADVFECLQIAAKVYAETGGAFDPTLGALMDARQKPETHRSALGHTGMNGLELREIRYTLPEAEADAGAEKSAKVTKAFVVSFRDIQGRASPGGLSLDLGGIGKGFALDRMVPILEDWGIENALIHAGTSTALALGSAGDTHSPGWPVGVGGEWSRAIGIERIFLDNAALSRSGIEVKGRHILDPRTGEPAAGHLTAWVRCPAAALADALSTAFLVMNTEEVEAYCLQHLDVSALLVTEGRDTPSVHRFGAWD